MICSLSEIAAALQKAAVGAGYSPGLAVSIAEAGVWLCSSGADGISAVLATALGGACRGFEFEAAVRTYTIQAAVAGLCGPSVFEFLATGQADQVVLYGVDSPVLLAGFAETIGAATGATFEFKPDPTEAAATTRIEVRRSARVRPEPHVAPHGVDIDPAAWAAVNELAARTYVPASEASRLKGAGAGLSDND